MKKDLHTLYIKYDGDFKTLSKIALSQLILKIIYLKGDGASISHIISEIEHALLSKSSKTDTESSLKQLIVEKKITHKHNKYHVQHSYKSHIKTIIDQNDNLHERVLNKYFRNAESDAESVKAWFQDTTIKFFEKFSFEWFFQITHKKKNGSINIPDLGVIIDETLAISNSLKSKDKDWLKDQYLNFIESDESDETNLFWNYGLAMFSSRLITARNYADKMSIDVFKNSIFLLDTNILMILELEGHELNKSFESFERILKQLKIKPSYLYVTKEEYHRAINARRNETIKVFNNFDIEVLKASKCPFIQTAIKRGCRIGEDVQRMFDPLMDVPSNFHSMLPLEIIDHAEIIGVIEEGKNDSDLKTKINDSYKKRTKRDKRNNPLLHDAGLIKAAQYIRQNEKCWIITNDSTLKLYAIDHCIRDENEIAIGLDVILGIVAVNGGGVTFDASNFAPLFKNLIKLSLMPESDSFEVRDLAFILDTNTKINELDEKKVIEVAKEVKRKRIAGELDENISLFLRRVMEGDKLNITQDIKEAKQKEHLAIKQKENAEAERNIFINNYRIRRQSELRDKYDKNLLYNRLFVLIIPLIVLGLIYFAFSYLIPDSSQISNFWIGVIIQCIFGILPLFPINKKFVKKYSEYVNGVDKIIEDEIRALKRIEQQ